MKNTCPVCNSSAQTTYRSKVESVYSDKPYNLGHCPTCDHYYTTPLPSSKTLDDIYTNKYSYAAHSLIGGEKRHRARTYAQLIKSLSGAASVLEVGCMHGLLLSAIQDLGLKVKGVELDPEAVKYCKDQGLEVTQNSVEDYLKTYKDQQQVVVMSHVLEHIVDPKTQLTDLKKTLTDDGRIFVIVPNSNSITRKLFGRYWGYWQVPVHINHFNKSSITKLFYTSGYQVETVRYFGGDSLFFLSTLANMLGNKSQQHDLSPAKKLLVKIATIALFPWYHIGNEDMLVVARKAS